MEVRVREGDIVLLKPDVLKDKFILNKFPLGIGKVSRVFYDRTGEGFSLLLINCNDILKEIGVFLKDGIERVLFNKKEELLK